jgi:hypothetical protein
MGQVLLRGCHMGRGHLRVVPADMPAAHRGESSILHLQVAGVADLRNARALAGQPDPGAGTQVGLQPDPAWALAFDAAGRLLA